MIEEFKDFINKGGVFEAAIGLIFALAFAPIIGSLVADVILPVVGRIFGAPDFSALKINLGGDTVIDPLTGEPTEAAIRYGSFLNEIITFIIIAATLFFLIKVYNKATKKVEEDPGPTETDLLAEIRDELKARPRA